MHLFGIRIYPHRHKWRRRFLIWGGGLLLLFTILFLRLVWKNNFDTPLPLKQELLFSHTRSVEWLIAHENELVSHDDPLLWWFIQRSSELSDDHRLKELSQRYISIFREKYPTSVWMHLVDPPSYMPLYPESVSHIPDYQQFFLYGSSCYQRLMQTPPIQRQLNTNFCSKQLHYGGNCASNQWLGVYMIKDNECLPEVQTEVLERYLLNRIKMQLTWDPRVVRVYIRRLTMLLLSGNSENIETAWVQRVLDRQRPDGGWADFDPFMTLGANRALGFTSASVIISKPKSDIMTTTLGMLATLLLLNHQMYQPQNAGQPAGSDI